MRIMNFLGAAALSGSILLALPVQAKIDIPSLSGYEQPRRTPSGSLTATPAIHEIQRGEILELGHSGPAVEIIRSLLQELDFEIAPAGDFFDRDMAWHIGQFQLKHQLAEPNSEHWGRVGPATLRALQDQAARGRFNAVLGHQLAETALRRARGSRGHCYRYVANAVHAHLPSFLTGYHAYMAASQLAASRFFKEVSVPSAELDSLPAGAIVVWGKGRSASGHISIADGQGREISDHISPQMIAHYGGASHRVFLPLGKS